MLMDARRGIQGLPEETMQMNVQEIANAEKSAWLESEGLPSGSDTR